jgi:hypothetical protein
MIFSWPIFFFSLEPHNLLYFVHNTIHRELNLKKYPKGSNNIIHINPSKIPTSFSFKDLLGLGQKTNYLSVNPNSPPFTFWTNERLHFRDPKHSNVNCPLVTGNSVHNIRGRQTKPETDPRISVHKQLFTES